MGNRQATDNRKSTAAPADDVTAADGGDRKQPQPEVNKKRRRGRGRKVTDVVAPQPSGLSGPCHPELITTTTLDTGEGDGSGNETRRLLHLTIYRSYSGAGSNGSAASHGIAADFDCYFTINEQINKKHISPHGPLLMPTIRPSLGLSPPKWEKTYSRRGRTAMQNFMPIGKTPAEKSATLHKKQKRGSHSKRCIPPYTTYGVIIKFK